MSRRVNHLRLPGEWLPEHVGIPIAEHSEGSYYMLEVHYNNPSMKKVVDSSGIRLHLTPKLRPQEAGILVAGVAVSPLHLIPPKQREYATAGYCTPHCTNTVNNVGPPRRYLFSGSIPVP